ncbi:MAG: hypothetical protein ACOCVL_00330 [Candidatus Sumerlaeota bacterium]
MGKQQPTIEKIDMVRARRKRRIVTMAFLALWVVNISLSFVLYQQVMIYAAAERAPGATERPPMMLDPERTPEDSRHIKRLTVMVVINAPAVALSSWETRGDAPKWLAALIIFLGASYVPAVIVAFVVITMGDRAVRKRHGWNPTMPPQE